jgi:phosphoribosylformimino-5-aminoimidazole carboxamide ribotide isomerase
MEIIPAIDLRSGRCVRLYQGDYQQETIYSDDPVGIARRWVDQGATRLHVVDLDGARSGHAGNMGVVQAIVEAVNIPVELGGGIRDMVSLAMALDMGVERAILGTSAVRDQSFVHKACKLHGGRVVVSVDARDGMVVTDGWLSPTRQSVIDLMQELVDLGVPRFVYTDVMRDGTLTGPNFEMLQLILWQVKAPIIASGGVSTLKQVEQLARVGVEGAIVGKALYTGDMTLPDAIEVAAASRPQEQAGVR